MYTDSVANCPCSEMGFQVEATAVRDRLDQGDVSKSFHVLNPTITRSLLGIMAAMQAGDGLMAPFVHILELGDCENSSGGIRWRHTAHKMTDERFGSGFRVMSAGTLTHYHRAPN